MAITYLNIGADDNESLSISVKAGSSKQDFNESRTTYRLRGSSTDNYRDAYDFIYNKVGQAGGPPLTLSDPVGNNIPISNIIASEQTFVMGDNDDPGGRNYLFEVEVVWSSPATSTSGPGSQQQEDITGQNLPETAFSFSAPGGRIFFTPPTLPTLDTSIDLTVANRRIVWDLRTPVDAQDNVRRLDETQESKVFDGLVGVKRGSRGWEHEGVELPQPTVNLGPFTVYYDPADITGNYVKRIAELVKKGGVNDRRVRIGGTTYEMGELRLVEVRGQSQDENNFSVSYGFEYIPNVTSIDLHNHTLVAFDGISGSLGIPLRDENGDEVTGATVKLGHQLMWTVSEDALEEDDEKASMTLRWVIVDSVWQHINFDLLDPNATIPL